ncbi:hypothetical protein Tco_0324677 [Tanacetum coccineum]
MLWDYLAHVSNQWVDKLVMMGDFNEGRYDYGPIPFRFYRYTSWKLDGGFGGGTSWLGNLGNVLLSNSRGEIYFLKEELRSCDEVIDKGDCSNEVVHKHKWAIEGDENVKFFHGMLNKKRNQSNIRGIMVNGTWVDDPVQVKREFFEHFRGRFDKPSVNRACIDTPFPVSCRSDQKGILERMISKEDVGSLMAGSKSNKASGLHPIEAGEWGEHAVLVEKDYALRYRDGGETSFWNDIWTYSGQTLSSCFPRLYALESNKHCRVNERWIVLNGVWGGHWEWCSSPRGRTLDEVSELSRLIGNLVPSLEQQDGWRWKLNLNGKFTVNNLSKLIDIAILGSNVMSYKVDWNQFV